LVRRELLGDRDADRARDPLAERSGRRLDADRVAVLRVPRGLRAELAEALELLDRQPVAREVEQGVEERGGVAAGEHEAVAVRPGRIVRAVPQVAGPDPV